METPEVLEDQIVAFIDLLSFSETTAQSNPQLQAGVLSLLTSIALLKSDFLSFTQITEASEATPTA